MFLPARKLTLFDNNLIQTVATKPTLVHDISFYEHAKDNTEIGTRYFFGKIKESFKDNPEFFHLSKYQREIYEWELYNGRPIESLVQEQFTAGIRQIIRGEVDYKDKADFRTVEADIVLFREFIKSATDNIPPETLNLRNDFKKFYEKEGRHIATEEFAERYIPHLQNVLHRALLNKEFKNNTTKRKIRKLSEEFINSYLFRYELVRIISDVQIAKYEEKTSDKGLHNLVLDNHYITTGTFCKEFETLDKNAKRRYDIAIKALSSVGANLPSNLKA